MSVPISEKQTPVPHFSSRAFQNKHLKSIREHEPSAPPPVCFIFYCIESRGEIYLNVEGSGDGDDLKQVVSQQEVTDGHKHDI